MGYAIVNRHHNNSKPPSLSIVMPRGASTVADSFVRLVRYVNCSNDRYYSLPYTTRGRHRPHDLSGRRETRADGETAERLAREGGRRDRCRCAAGVGAWPEATSVA